MESSEIFNPLFTLLLEVRTIEVSISEELEIWTNTAGENQIIIEDFFSVFIFESGEFHRLLEQSDAIGDCHDFKLSLRDENILMEGKTMITGQLERKLKDSSSEKYFMWMFDRNGNLL